MLVVENCTGRVCVTRHACDNVLVVHDAEGLLASENLFKVAGECRVAHPRRTKGVQRDFAERWETSEALWRRALPAARQEVGRLPPPRCVLGCTEATRDIDGLGDICSHERRQRATERVTRDEHFPFPRSSRARRDEELFHTTIDGLGRAFETRVNHALVVLIALAVGTCFERCLQQVDVCDDIEYVRGTTEGHHDLSQLRLAPDGRLRRRARVAHKTAQLVCLTLVDIDLTNAVCQRRPVEPLGPSLGGPA
mmetsp:Transcript_33528/g.88286  ORF Transcript_33528/g.88286 Transcript_33528/m.88286 type:complete len:252 (-) Transcript_33528:1412-2167(-)